MNKYRPVYRVIGNTCIFFVAPYVGSAIIDVPSVEMALWAAFIGFIASVGRECLAKGGVKNGEV